MKDIHNNISSPNRSFAVRLSSPSKTSAQDDRVAVRVCSSRSCTVFGGKRVMQAITDATGLKPGEKNDTMDLDWSGCLGYCARSPNVQINHTHYIFTAKPDTIMQDIQQGGVNMTGKELDIEQEYQDLFKDDILEQPLPKVDISEE